MAISLKSADNEIFEVEEAIAMEFVTIKAFFDESPSDVTVVPLPNVSSKALTNVIAYCKKELEFRSASAPEEEKKKKFDEFLKEKSNDEVKEMLLAANYLNIKYLLDTLTLDVADRIKNKSVEYVRRFFGVDNDFTDEEEANLRAENAWAFEDVDPDEKTLSSFN